MAKKNTFTVHRNAKTGRLVKESTAKRMKPENVIREQMPKAGRGDTGRSKKK